MSHSQATKPSNDEAGTPLSIKASVQSAARSAVGINGDQEIPPWKVATPPSGRRQVLGLALINASVSLPLTTLLLLIPAVARANNWSTSSIGFALIAGAVLAGLLAVPLSDRVPTNRRSTAAAVFAINSALFALLMNLIPAFGWFLLVALARGVIFSLGAPLWRTLAFDAVIPEARARAIARTQMGTVLGSSLGGVCAWGTFSGRGFEVGDALLLSGILAVALSLGSLLIKDTDIGGFEPERLRQATGKVNDPEVRLRPSWGESITRVRSIRTVKFGLTSYVAIGWCTGGGLIVPAIGLAQSRGFSPPTPALVITIASAVTFVALALFSRGLEKSIRRSPETLAAVVPLGLIIGFAGLLLTGIISPSISPQLALVTIGGFLALVALDVTMLSVVQPEDRATAIGLSIFSLIGGTLTALLLLSAISSLVESSAAYSIAFAVASFPLLLICRRSTKLRHVVGSDLDARLRVDDETQDFDQAVSEPAPSTPAVAGVEALLALLKPHKSDNVPVLWARNLDFSYGSVQVLFDVSLRINEGEMVALLGPNGVGKTTLLRVLSGLETPEVGVIRLCGEDVTDMTANKRVALGLSQIVGGNAVFGSMTVYENLTMYGFSLGRDRATIKDGIEEAFEIFPKLADRRSQLGSTLSGGEQQMLGLSKAIITRPRVLVVDEFSLGLAPIVVGELLGMVRQLNATGTAILIVEQSVNVALNLVDRCYFMEKGKITYEGKAKDLLENPELVQALSLGGHPETTDSNSTTLENPGSSA